VTNSTIFENPAVTRRAWRWARLCLILVILLSGTSCQQAGWMPGPDKADLEGVWRDVGSPKHLNRFRGDGVLDGSWGGLQFGNAGTWSRSRVGRLSARSTGIGRRVTTISHDLRCLR